MCRILAPYTDISGSRGADVRNILDFCDDFPDARVVKLEQNYRSTQTILSAANAVIANDRGAMKKALWTDLGDGDPIRLRVLADEHAEARYVLGEIERMVDEGVSRSEIAVFYRTNAQSRVLEDTLVRAEIPYQVMGGNKFYERAEIKDAVAYLSLLGNPADEVAFVGGVGQQRQIGDGVLDLGALVELGPPDHLVGNFGPDERVLEHPRLGVGPVEHGDLAATDTLVDEPLDLAEHEPGLGVLVGHHAQLDRVAVAELGPQRLLHRPAVVGDDGVGGREDGLGRAVVLLELDHVGIGVVVTEVEDVARTVGAAEAN